MAICVQVINCRVALLCHLQPKSAEPSRNLPFACGWKAVCLQPPSSTDLIFPNNNYMYRFECTQPRWLLNKRLQMGLLLNLLESIPSELSSGSSCAASTLATKTQKRAQTEENKIYGIRMKIKMVDIPGKELPSWVWKRPGENLRHGNYMAWALHQSGPR